MLLGAEATAPRNFRRERSAKMPQHYHRPTQKRPQSKVYKAGKLSRSTRFARRRIDKKWTVLIFCVLASFLFAVILGNILGDKARNSQSNINNAGSSSSIDAPSVDKTSPKLSLHAYYADMSGADPNASLSEQTGDARSKGNALYIEIRNGGALTYSSEKASELGYSQSSNLALLRLGNHFDYYNDYAVGYFKSDFSASLDNEARMQAQSEEALLLAEAVSVAFDQIIIEFTGEVHRYNAIYYQTYLLNLKLACEGTPVGVKLPYSFLSSSENSGVVSEILAIADFCVVDLGSRSADELKASLDSISYFAERYNAVIMIGAGDEATLSERISALEAKGFKSYIVK